MTQVRKKSIRQPSPPKALIGAPDSNHRWQVAGLSLVLAAITFAVFGQTLHHEFVDFDDNTYVYQNPIVIPGLTLKGIVWAFIQSHASNWHPLTWLSHMLDCQFYGLNPGGHHLTNVLLHTATVIALFLVLRQMTGALWRSAFVAAVFAIHPLRAESVAWVAERKDVLSGLFFMLTIGAYIRYARRPWSPVRYGLVVLLFALGLMCKPMLVTLPVVLLLLDYWPLQRVEPRKLSGLVMEKLPLLALSAATCAITLVAQHKAIQLAESHSLPLRFGNALEACMVYLRQMIWPAGLAAFYPYPRNGLSAWEVGLAGTLLASLSAFALGRRRTQPWLLVGWLWYLVMLLPVVGIIQVGGQAHADRYTYLPQIGIYLAVTWLATEWAAKLHVGRAAIGSLMAGVAGVLMVCAWKQTAYWKNSETLWIHTLGCTQGNALAHNDLGGALDQKGRVDEAILHFEKAVEIKPDYAEAENNLGNALDEKGRADEAIAHYHKALAIRPDYAEAHYNLGNALLHKGSVDEAIAQFQKALQIDPDDAESHNNLGNALLQKGRLDEAIAQFQKSLEIKPRNAEAHLNLALGFHNQGRVDEAIAHYQNALEIKPDDVDAHNRLAQELLRMGRVSEAITHFQQALQIDPANLEIQSNLAWLLATGPDASLRNGNKAVELAKQANALAGGKNPLVLRTLAAALAETGRFDDARRTAQTAMELAQAAGQHDLATQIKGEFKRYEAGQPLHQ